MPSKKRLNGEGSVYQRGSDGKWCGTYTVGVKPDGSPNRKTVYGKTAAEAEAKLSKALAQLRAGTYIDPQKMTVSDWLCEWLETYARRPGAKPSTGDEYERVITHRIRPHLGGLRLQKLRPEHVQRWINLLSQTYAPATVKASHRVLSLALKQAVINQHIPFNPAQNALLPRQTGKTDNPPAPLTAAEQDVLLNALPDSTAGRALAFLVFTGMRVGECCALRWEDVSADKISIRHTAQRIKNRSGDSRTVIRFDEPKTASSRRDIPLSSQAYAILDRQRETQRQAAEAMQTHPPSFVFATGTGREMSSSHLTQTLYNTCAKIGMPRRSPHDLRHTFGTRLNERGADVITIAQLMGHSSPTITMQTYIHPDNDQKRRAIALLEDGK